MRIYLGIVALLAVAFAGAEAFKDFVDNSCKGECPPGMFSSEKER